MENKIKLVIQSATQVAKAGSLDSTRGLGTSSHTWSWCKIGNHGQVADKHPGQLAPPGVNMQEICKGNRNQERNREPSADDAGLTWREDGKERGRAGREEPPALGPL